MFFRKKFRGISSQPAFCQAIYQSFKNQQANSAAIITKGEEQQGYNQLNWSERNDFFLSIATIQPITQNNSKQFCWGGIIISKRSHIASAT